jgi:hypothetical protein
MRKRKEKLPALELGKFGLVTLQGLREIQILDLLLKTGRESRIHAATTRQHNVRVKLL